MNYAIILAGGTGQRMRQSGMPKQFLDVYGKPIIIYTLEAFQENALIDEIIIPCNASWIDYLHNLVDRYQITKAKYIVAGGKDRNGSILAGLHAVAPSLKEKDIVVIHDGVKLYNQGTMTFYAHENVENLGVYIFSCSFTRALICGKIIINDVVSVQPQKEIEMKTTDINKVRYTNRWRIVYGICNN